MICPASSYAANATSQGHGFQQVVFWGLWRLWPMLLGLLVPAWRRRRRWDGWSWAAWSMVLAAVAVPIDMRFIERDGIVERHSTFGSARWGCRSGSSTRR